MSVNVKTELDASAWPRFTIVTPVFNQAQYIEQTIRSILDQDYPNLEYIIIDGGSTDGTLEIIHRYVDRLAYWISAPDKGMYDAVNKGFLQSSGEVMSWLNSDDLYLPYTLRTIARVFNDMPHESWVSTRAPVIVNDRGEATEIYLREGYCRTWFQRGWHLDLHPQSKGTIMQEGTFWRRSLWERAGGQVRSDLALAGDYELWSRFWKEADLITLGVPLACFRRHAGQKTNNLVDYVAEAKCVCPSAPDGSVRQGKWRQLLACGRKSAPNLDDLSKEAVYDAVKRIWSVRSVQCDMRRD